MDPEQVRQLQKQLAEQGLYGGEIDGVMGPQTRSAMEAAQKRKAEKRKAQELDLEQQQAKNRAQELELEKQRNDPVNQLVEFGKDAGTVGAGYYTGHKIGGALDKAQTAQEAKRGLDLSKLAQMDDADPRVTEQVAKKRGLFKPTGGQYQYLLPALLGGVGTATREYVAPQFEDPTTQEAVRLLGTGEQAAGVGLAGKQIYSGLTRGDQANPADEVAIRSRAAQANAAQNAAGKTPLPAKDAPQAKASLPAQSPAPAQSSPPAQATAAKATSEATEEATTQNAQRMREAARAAGAKNVSKMTKADAADFLSQNVTKENRAGVGKALGVHPGRKFTTRIRSKIRDLTRKPGASSILGPAIAGALTYDAVTSGAEAGDGEVTNTDRAKGAAAGAGAAGLTAGAGYGLSKAAPYVSRALPGLLPAAGGAAGLYGAYELGRANMPTPANVGEGEEVAQRDQFFSQQQERMRGAGIDPETQAAVAEDILAQAGGPKAISEAYGVPQGAVRAIRKQLMQYGSLADDEAREALSEMITAIEGEDAPVGNIIAQRVQALQQPQQ